MDKRAQTNNLFLDTLLPLCNDAITIIDQDGFVLSWNEAAENIYTIPQHEIVGRQISDFFKTEDLMVLRILQNPFPVRGVYHRPRPDTHVLIHASPVFDSKKKLIGAISAEQNISELVKLNDELNQTSTQLDLLKNQVNSAPFNEPFSSIKGHSRRIKEVIQLATKVASTNATVLITGESGVGKELFARAIHDVSPRKERSFIAVNCGAIPGALFESELFGYEGGAFTGAAKEGKRGKLELANEGTLFLDEIGELPLDMQVKLLRVLQDQEFYRVGGTKGITVNVRIIAATNRQLEKMVQDGRFREDLYYRLHVVALHIPPLRERLEDVPELVQLFLQEYSVKYAKSAPLITTELHNQLLDQRWPGNIRQLRNVIERMVVLSDHQQTPELSDLPQIKKDSAGHSGDKENSLKSEKKKLEKEHIEQALYATYGNKSAAAKKLGISRASLYQKIERYGIKFNVEE
jgi:PAS domain S-box-containing protein